MEKVTLGRSGLRVSALGLGGIQFSKISRAEVARVVGAALDRGIDFLETAHGYFDSEAKIGAALGRRRGRVVLASKNSARDGASFTRQLEESLRRLRTDVIDLYQLHGVDSQEALAESLRPRGAVAAAQKALRQGKIRSLGITSHSLALSLRAVEMEAFESLQYPISLINTEVARSGLLGEARRRGVGLIAMKPLGGGRLANPALALGYIYRFRGVVPVVGVETPAQVAQLARIARRPPRLGPAEFEKIRQIRRTVGTTFCRACRYCEPCPQGISIFRVLYFPVYVKQMGARRVLKSGRRPESRRAAVEDLRLPDYLARAGQCVESRSPRPGAFGSRPRSLCRLCERRCPFHLRIVDGLKDSLALGQRLLRSQS